MSILETVIAILGLTLLAFVAVVVTGTILAAIGVLLGVAHAIVTAL